MTDGSGRPFLLDVMFIISLRGSFPFKLIVSKLISLLAVLVGTFAGFT